MVIVLHIDEMWFSPSRRAKIETVDGDLHLVRGTRECTVGRRVRRGDVFYWMVKGKLLGGVIRRNVLLNLGD